MRRIGLSEAGEARYRALCQRQPLGLQVTVVADLEAFGVTALFCARGVSPRRNNCRMTLDVAG